MRKNKAGERIRKKRWVKPRILRELELETRAAYCGPGFRAKIVRQPPFCVIAYS
jgi:hypothetical protein